MRRSFIHPLLLNSATLALCASTPADAVVSIGGLADLEWSPPEPPPGKTLLPFQRVSLGPWGIEREPRHDWAYQAAANEPAAPNRGGKNLSPYRVAKRRAKNKAARKARRR